VDVFFLKHGVEYFAMFFGVGYTYYVNKHRFICFVFSFQ